MPPTVGGTKVTAYDFEDDEQSNDLGDIGKKLSQASKSKDSLIKLLKVHTELTHHLCCVVLHAT